MELILKQVSTGNGKQGGHPEPTDIPARGLYLCSLWYFVGSVPKSSIPELEELIEEGGIGTTKEHKSCEEMMMNTHCHLVWWLYGEQNLLLPLWLAIL